MKAIATTSLVLVLLAAPAARGQSKEPTDIAGTLVYFTADLEEFLDHASRNKRTDFHSDMAHSIRNFAFKPHGSLTRQIHQELNYSADPKTYLESVIQILRPLEDPDPEKTKRHDTLIKSYFATLDPNTRAAIAKQIHALGPQVEARQITNPKVDGTDIAPALVNLTADLEDYFDQATTGRTNFYSDMAHSIRHFAFGPHSQITKKIHQELNDSPDPKMYLESVIKVLRPLVDKHPTKTKKQTGLLKEYFATLDPNTRSDIAKQIDALGPKVEAKRGRKVPIRVH